jgi:hypothetical protein
VRGKDNDVVVNVLMTRLKLILFLHGLPLFGWEGLDFILTETEKEGNVQYIDSRGGRNVSEGEKQCWWTRRTIWRQRIGLWEG